MVEEEPGIEVAFELHLEEEPRLAHDEACLGRVRGLVLSALDLAPSHFEVTLLGRDAERFGHHEEDVLEVHLGARGIDRAGRRVLLDVRVQVPDSPASR